jgi:hypothetical protein
MARSASKSWAKMGIIGHIEKSYEMARNASFCQHL